MNSPRTFIPALVPPMGTPRAIKPLSAFDCTNNKRVICRGPVWNDQGRDGILVWTKLLDVRIIGVRPGSSNNKKVPIATSLAHPLESGIHVCASSHQHRPRGSRGGDVGWVP